MKSFIRIRKDKIDRAHNTHVSNEKYKKSFGQKILTKEATWKT
jgi:hypothetical protein